MTEQGGNPEPLFPVLAHLPTERSEPLAHFVTGFRETVDFVFFTASLAGQVDDMRKTAMEALRDTAHSIEERERLDSRLATEGDAMLKELRRFRLVVLETLTTRGVDNFLTYVADLLATIFRARPETLRSSETVRLDFVLRHSAMDDLVDSLAERRVERLAYQGMGDLVDDLRKTVGFELFLDDESVVRAVRIIETRNLIVHNRGVVNRRYAARVLDPEASVGERIPLDFALVASDLNFIAEAAVSIDARAVLKWGLPVTRESVGMPASTGKQPPD